MKNLIAGFLYVVLFEAFLIGGVRRYDDRFVDYGVYIIQNRVLQGVLTLPPINVTTTNATTTEAPPSTGTTNATEGTSGAPANSTGTMNSTTPASTPTNSTRTARAVLRSLAPIIANLEGNSSSQRWRLEKSAMYNSFEIRSLTDEKYVLVFYTGESILGAFDTMALKRWYLQDAGDDYTIIRHRRQDICLEGVRNGEAVIAGKCTGKLEQQWLFRTRAA